MRKPLPPSLCVYRSHGFTLIELVLVLVILVILATLALQTVENQVDQERFDTGQQSVENANDAIFKTTTTRDGRVVYSGFYVDLGRLPHTREETSGSDILTANELWTREDSPALAVPDYTNVSAETVNLTTTDDTNDEDSDEDTVIPDPDVLIDMGWRGPYLALPLGANILQDGYGHRLTSSKLAGNLSHLRGNGDVDITGPDIPVFAIRTFGRSDLQDAVGVPDADTYERDVPRNDRPLPIDMDLAQVTGTVRGEVHVFDSAPMATLGTIDPDDVAVQIYFPSPNDAGELKVGVQRAENDSFELPALNEITDITGPSHSDDYKSFSFKITDNDITADFRIPAGTRIIRAYYDDGTEYKSVIKSVEVVAGMQTSIILSIDIN